MRISHFTVTFIALCLSFLTGPLRGQGSHPFRHLNVDNGLSSNYVVDIAQDYQGFIWIATESGLNKFDGTEVTVYNTQNSALSSNELNTVYGDPSTRTVYIGTQRHGLCVYDCVSQQFTARYNSQNGLLSSDVTDLSRAADGGIWVTHYHLGVEHFDPKSHTFTPWRMSDIAHFEGTSWCSRDDGNGHLYVGHDGQGMSLIDLKQRTCRSFTHQDDPHSLPGNIVHCIFIDRDHRVWVGTNNGLALFHPEQGTFTTFRHEEGNPHSLLSNYVYDIGQADDGRLWVCTQMGGVSILDPQALSSGDVRFDNIGAGQRDGISSANARCFFQDSFGNIWIGNYRQGIDFLSYERPIFRTLLPTGSSTDASGANQVWSLAVDNRWQASEGPEVVWHNGWYYLFLAYDALPYNTRVVRAKSITGPYYNILGEDVTRGGDALPVVTHPYKFTGSDGWVGIFHCAIFTDGDDHWFYASQGRLPKEVNNANMLGHIRSIRWTADGWPLVMPERYGAVPQAPITEAEIAGTWEHIDFSYKYGVQKESQPMEFRADHTIGSGPWQGAKWSFDASRQVIQVDNGTDLYLCRETDWEAKPRTHTLIYAAYSNTGKTYWGKKSK